MTAFHTDSDCRYAYAETDDPRVLAVIVLDEEPHAPYGDALAPAYYLNRSPYGGMTAERAGDVFHDDESDEIAARYCEVFDRFRYAAGDMLARWLRIFHGVAAVDEIAGGYHADSNVLIFDSPNYRKHTGCPPPSAENPDPLAGERAEWRAYLDGDVYGIGYAVNPERVLHNPDDAPGGPDFNPSDWDVDIECWGFYGRTYAEEAAAAFEYGAPDLPEMIDAEGVFA